MTCILPLILLFSSLFSVLSAEDSDLPEGFTECGFDQEDLEILDSHKTLEKSVLPHIEPPPAEGSLARSILESGPSSVVAGCVSAISGDFFESEVDFIVPGIEPLVVERSYSSSDKKWHYRHRPELELAPSRGGHHVTAVYQDDSGFGLFYRERIHKHVPSHQIHLSSEAFQKGLTNYSSGEISGRSNWKNSKLRLVQNKNGKQIMFTTGGGVRRLFKRYDKNGTSRKKGVFFGKFKISSEYRPNGNFLKYHYEKKKYGLVALKDLSQIAVKNSAHQEMGFITYTHEENRMLWDSPYQRADYELDNQGRLLSVNNPERPPVRYHYDANGRLYKKTLPEGRFHSVLYYTKGANRGKVEKLYSSGNGDLPTHSFQYVKGCTVVTDALGNRTIYSYNSKTKRLESIKKEGKREEQFIWAHDLGSLAGHLVGRKLQSEGQEIFSQSIAYDSYGNITTEKLIGNLTGSASTDVYVKTFRSSQDGKNLPLEENDGRKWTRFAYHPKTQQLIKRLNGDGEKILKREFFSYDQYGALAQEILDDGDSADEDNLNHVSERYLKMIVNTSTFPYGLPESIEEFFYDQQSASYVFLKKVVNRYSLQGKVIQESHYGSDQKLAYEIFRNFDAHGNLLQEIDALGGVTTYTYDALGNKIAEETPHTKKRFTYDLSNRLIEESELGPNSEWLTTYHSYNAMGQRITTTDPCGDQAHFEYDFLGRLTKKTLLLEEPCIETYAYDAMGNITIKIDPNGNMTRSQYTIRGNPYLIEYPDGSKEEKTYSLDGLLIKEVAKNGLETWYTYDSFGNVIRKRIGDKETSAVYSAFHILQETDEEGIVTDYKYDGAGRLTAKVKGEKSIHYTYDHLGREATVTSSDKIIRKEYDAKGRVVIESEESTAGITYIQKSFVYDFNGNILRRQIGDVIVETTYTPQGKPLEERDALGNITRYAYEFFPKYRVTKIDPLGNQERITYNGRDQVSILEHFSPLGECVQKENRFYDQAGLHIRTESLVLPGNETRITAWSYDSLGRLISTIEAKNSINQRRTDTRYNLNGEQSKTILPSGIEIDYAYDRYGRLIHLSSSDQTIDYIYQYDIKDRVITAEDRVKGITTSKTYDDEGRLSSETLGNGLILSYDYNGLDQLTKIILPDHSEIRYAYDGGQITSVERVQQDEIIYSHQYLERNLAGQITLEKLIDGQNLIRKYDATGHLNSISAPQFNEQITYDAVGNPLTRHLIDADGAHDYIYTYDALYQLLSENGAASHQYHYDSLHNRIGKDGIPCPANALNQIESFDSTIYEYDLDGNLTAKSQPDGKISLHYDALSRLIGVSFKDRSITYTYDAFHRRLSKQDGDQITAYIYQEDNEIGAQLNGAITELRLLGSSYGAEIGATVALELNGLTYLPISDSTGNLSQLTNLTAHITESTRFSAFGETLSSSKSPWLYSSKRFDPETGFYYFGRRYLDPQLGRWITKDPLGFADGLNLYAYVHNRPLTHIDPDGQFAILIPIAISLVAEYTIPFAAIALQEAGYITAAAFITGVVQGYNGSVLEGSPIEGLDANTAIAGNAGKALGLALCCANPRKGITNVARTAVAKEASVAATTVAAKAANKWSTAVVKQAPREAARKTNQIAQKGVLKSSQSFQIACQEAENIPKYTSHGLDQLAARGVSRGNVLDTIKNPLKIGPVVIDELGRPSQRYIGQYCEVAINPETRYIVSVNPTSTKKANRLMKQGSQ